MSSFEIIVRLVVVWALAGVAAYACSIAIEHIDFVAGYRTGLICLVSVLLGGLGVAVGSAWGDDS